MGIDKGKLVLSFLIDIIICRKFRLFFVCFFEIKVSKIDEQYFTKSKYTKLRQQNILLEKLLKKS